MRRMKARKTLRTAIAAIATCVLLFLAGAGSAQADASCNVFFDNLRRAAAQPPRNFIHVLWTTNYFTASTRFMATTRVHLVAGHGDLAGSAVRRQSVVGPDLSRPVERNDNVVLRIRGDGRVMLNDRYGPYDPACSQGKFAVLNTGDSIEVLNFTPVSASMTGLEGQPGATLSPPNPGTAPGGDVQPAPSGTQPTTPYEWCEHSAVDGVVRFYESYGERYRCPSRVIVADVSQWHNVNNNHAYFTFTILLEGRGMFATNVVVHYRIIVENWADHKTCRVTAQEWRIERKAGQTFSTPAYTFMRNLAARSAVRWFRASEFGGCKDAIWEGMRFQ